MRVQHLDEMNWCRSRFHMVLLNKSCGLRLPLNWLLHCLFSVTLAVAMNMWNHKNIRPPEGDKLLILRISTLFFPVQT